MTTKSKPFVQAVKVEFIQVGRDSGVENVLKVIDNKPMFIIDNNSAFSLDVSDRGPLLIGRATRSFLLSNTIDFAINRKDNDLYLKDGKKEYPVSHAMVLDLKRSFYMISSFYDPEQEKTFVRLEMSRGFVESMRLIDIIRLTRITKDHVA